MSKYVKKRTGKVFIGAVLLIGLFMLAHLSCSVFAADKQGVAKAADGNWYYYDDNKVTDYTGLAKYNGAWWYFEEGKLDFGYTGLCKYNGSWWYVSGGKVNFSAPDYANIMVIGSM